MENIGILAILNVLVSTAPQIPCLTVEHKFQEVRNVKKLQSTEVYTNIAELFKTSHLSEIAYIYRSYGSVKIFQMNGKWEQFTT